jgi:outer membrane protein assembly factor BamB
MASARTAFAFLTLLAMALTAGGVYGQQSPADASKANFERLCGSCHEAERSTSSRRTRDQWLQTVNQMVARGAEGTDEELLAVVDYLTREHGRVNVNLANAADLALVLALTPAEGAAIVQYRRERGTFEDAAAVEKVPGVDAGKLAARRDAMVFGSRVASTTGRVPVSALTAANNWPGISGGPQRDGWARPEAMLSKGTVSSIKLLYARKLDNQNRGMSALTPPLILGNLISYRGFKEMLFLGGSSDNVYAIDAVLNRIIWSTRLPSADATVRLKPDPTNTTTTNTTTTGTATCPGGLMGVVMNGSASGGLIAAGGIRRGGPGPARGVAPGAGRSGLVVGLAGGFGRNGLVLAVGSDGDVHALYQSTGASFGSPIKFLPAHSNISALNLFDNTLYAATIRGCGGPNAVYALDLATEEKALERFETNGSGASGTAGTAIGNDGTVYLQVADGRGDVAEPYHDTVLALSPKDLNVKDYFAPSRTAAASESLAHDGITPVVFQWNGKDIVVAGSRDGRLFVLDSMALGGADHRTPLAQTAPIATVDPKYEGYGIRGAFASWQDPETGSRWIYAPLWGPPNSAVKFPMTNGPIRDGGIAAFRLHEQKGRPVISLEWISRDMVAPTAPVVANGLVFALSSGELWRRYGDKVVDRSSSSATLYALDAGTGRELFNSGNAATRSSNAEGSGLAVANGRVYFGTSDNTVYCFGIPTEH